MADAPTMRERIKDLVFYKVEKEINSQERKELEDKYQLWRERYKAKRSAEGHKWWGEDPDASPKDVPWENCSDVGHPIELQIIQELLPRVLNAHVGTIPITESKRLADGRVHPHGDLDYFFYNELIHKAKLKPLRRRTLLTSYKCGESIEKPVLEEKSRFAWEDRYYLVSGDEVMLDYTGNPLEFMDPEIDLRQFFLVWIRKPDNPRSIIYRYHREQLEMNDEFAMQAAGIEVKGETVRIAPEPDLDLMQRDQVGAIEQMWREAKTYKIEARPVREKIVYDRGLTFIEVRPENFIWPSDATSSDVMDHWVCHRWWPTLDWLQSRTGEDGFSKEVIDKLIDKYRDANVGMKGDSTKTEDIYPEVWEVYDRVVLNNSDPSKPDYMREVEIIAWLTPEMVDDPVIGWMENPATRFPIRHIRPFFVFQVKPEEGQAHGLSVPETSAGGRWVIDKVLNSSLDRMTMYTDPVIKMTPAAFKRGNLEWGPNAKWIVDTMDQMEVVRLFVPERQSAETSQMFITWLRMIWGSSEMMAGFRTDTTSRTLGEVNLLQQLGHQMFYDTVETLAQTSDSMYEYIRCLYRFSAVGQKIEFPLEDDRVKILNPEMLEGNILIKHRRAVTEAERQEKLVGLQMFIPMLTQLSPVIAQHPEYMAGLLNLLRDLLNLETLPEIDPQELVQLMQAATQGEQQAEQRGRFQQQLRNVENKGARRQIESFLEQTGAFGGDGGQAARPEAPTRTPM